MAVIPRKRASGTVFGVERVWNGKRVWELVGPNRREAGVRDRAMKKEIADGTYQPKGMLAERLGQYAQVWLDGRTNAYKTDEARLVRLHVASRPWLADKLLDDVKPKDTDALVRELRAETKPSGARRLSDKTIANLLGVLSLVFDAAVRAEVCLRNPITLAPGTLKRRPKQEKEVYSIGEAVVLVRHNAISWPIRVLNALCLFGGLREGEACGRRWRDLDGSPKPLACLSVHDQYDGRPLKTDRPRLVPVHPLLAAELEAWATEGYELYTGRRPDPDAFIVPNTGRRASAANHTRSSYYKAFVKYAEAAGVPPRSLHATRHTFITHCRRGGARKDVLERITHNARGDIVDRYTHFDWEPLCEAVLCFRPDAHRDLPPTSGKPGESCESRSLPVHSSANESAALPVGIPGSIPGASTTNKHETSYIVKPRRGSRREAEWNPGELSGDNRRRKRALLSLAGADPAAARPGLALTRGLDAAYRLGAGDERASATLAGALAVASDALEHLLPDEVRADLVAERAARGGRP